MVDEQGVAGPAAATTVTNTFQAQIIIQDSCRVNLTNPTTLNFGTQGVLAANVDTTSTITLTCSTSTAYNVLLDAGSNPSSAGDVATRRMTNGSSYVGYQMYSDSSRASVWGDSGSNDGHGDRLRPSTDLVLSPPLIELQPGQQLVRVIRTAAAPAAEQAYRILVDFSSAVRAPSRAFDLAHSAKNRRADAVKPRRALPDPARPVRNGLNFVMQFSVPVFAAAAAPGAAAQIEWSLRQESGQLQLVSMNRGGRRAQITELELRDAQGRVQLARPGLLGYALAGSGRRWNLELPSAVAAAVSELQLRINGQVVRQPLRVAGDAR